MASKNEHVCVLRKESTLRMVGKRIRHDNKKPYEVRFGIVKAIGPDGSTDQSYRYPTEAWSATEARMHCVKKGGISFTPAPEPETTSPEIDAAAEKLKSSLKL